MIDLNTDTERLHSFGFPIIEGLDDLSYRLLLSKNLLYKLSKFNSQYYKTFNIPKKHKGVREISSPTYALRVIQSWILIDILYKIPINNVAMGFRKGENYGIKSNASNHINKDYILKMDIQDFFPSIDRRKIYPLFKSLGYSQFISNVFTNYCSFNGHLPQGASTSPCISNIVFKSTDEKIIEYCINNAIKYTRYADDLIFSSNSKSAIEDLIEIVEEIVKKDGYSINKGKTKLMHPAGRKIVTGIVINSGETKVLRKAKRDIRAMIFNDIFKNNTELSEKTKGYLSFIRYIEKDRYDNLQKYIEQLKAKKKKQLHNEALLDFY
jgi:RNA-directed DNA polymerase